MNLYEINAEIMKCIDEETGEILDEAYLNDLQIAEEEKIENIALWIKNLKAEAEALKKEKQSFDERKKRAESKAESLQKYLSNYLSGKKFNTSKVAISWRQSESVVIDDPSKVPQDFIEYEPKINKADIKDVIKSGVKVEGCHLEEKNNIQIK